MNQVLSENDKTLVDKISLESKHFDRSYFDSLSKGEQDHFIKIIQELQTNGESPTLNNLWEIDYERKPVSLLEFVQDDYYLGGVYGKRLFPGWIEPLQEIEADPTLIEICLTGSIGIGKSNIGAVILLHDLHKLLCLRNPQAFHGLTPTTKIQMAIFNITLDLAGAVGLQIWTDNIAESPYFQEIIEFNPRSPESINFPKNIDIVVGSRFKHSLGQAVFSAFLDEANFGQGTASTQKQKGAEGETSQILESYLSLLRRMESRFIEEGGKIPGHMILVSSKKSKNDFLESHIKNQSESKTTYVVDSCIYKMRTHKYDEESDKFIKLYSGEKFRVMIGDQRKESRLLQLNEAPPDGYHVEEVPIEYHESFQKDIENSLRDISGISLHSESSFILNRPLFRKSINTKRFNPFTKDVIELSFGGDDKVSDWIEEGFKVDGTLRAIHIDIGITGDALGMAMGCISGRKAISKLNIDLEYSDVLEYLYHIDFYIRIKYESKDQLPLFKISQFIVELRDLFGVNVGHVSADGFQSAYMLQLMRAKGIGSVNSKNKGSSVISLDRTPDGYQALKNAHYEGRIDCPLYEPYIIEMLSLVQDNQTLKVDHQVTNIDGSNGSKDVSDGAAGVVQSLNENPVFTDAANQMTGADLDKLYSEVYDEVQSLKRKEEIKTVQQLMNEHDDDLYSEDEETEHY